MKKIGLKKQKTRRSTGTNFLLFSCGYRPSEPSFPRPRKVILDLVSPLDLIPKYFPFEVKERLGIKGIPVPGKKIKKEKMGGEKNKKTAQKERLNLVETEKVSLCRQMILVVLTIFKKDLSFNKQDISKK